MLIKGKDSLIRTIFIQWHIFVTKEIYMAMFEIKKSNGFSYWFNPIIFNPSSNSGDGLKMKNRLAARKITKNKGLPIVKLADLRYELMFLRLVNKHTIK